MKGKRLARQASFQQLTLRAARSENRHHIHAEAVQVAGHIDATSTGFMGGIMAAGLAVFHQLLGFCKEVNGWIHRYGRYVTHVSSL
ncbi:hypothetical protein GCM10007071_25590 [Marinobacter zhanjiangensis]|uniref:Uncharacterized protein n=1 Tax=Marinobacter zhanjiangensis TaxID=578215 RepID=A0ABQ3B3R0_9GAMM|nr:hypothetical protein GCM10007071_25590 [Marinobacter zhanjiangensis]